ncbi:MAG: hypothetical protein V4692_07130, partial [Bdellovibrionota bacterium]
APRAMPPVAFSAEKSGKTWKISAPEAEGSGPGGLQGDLDSTKLDLLLQRLVKLETVKFLDPVKSSAERVDSLIRASDATGKVVFEMEWGLSILRKQMDGLEIHMVPARTSLANRWLGLTESSITELKLRELRNSSAE